MTIRYQCPECDAAMKIKDEKAGTVGHCPKCKAEFIVPAPEGDEPAEATYEVRNKVEEVRDTVEKSVSKGPAKTAEEIAEDEFQAILMGGDSPQDKRPRGMLLDSEQEDEAPRKRQNDFDSSSAAVADPEPPKARARTTAEISKSMMGKNSEPVMKKTGKPFGEGNTETEGARAKAAREARAYYAKQLTVGGIGLAAIFAVMYWLVMSGMSSGKIPPLGWVSGTVTLDGNALPGASVMFQPVVDASRPKGKGNSIAGSTAFTDKSGKYTLLYVQDVQGAVVGKHIVQITGQNEVGVEMVPPKYNHNSELTFEVKSGSNPPADFKLSSK